ncbi:hypothetical protein D7Y13_06630 [Corallococcus praedator]|uniref:Uncharacterized protein n=1 Tax=Corallococcus praedator TaxID=2316724 RepID=A0ABX9QMZ7_9BACT|nr:MULTISPECIES: hypothetical protein [Corallococcus]RKH21494.1 hypothetical protein D7X74_00945 [Corallococcus sp. CA047B]RKH35736.1 hypothetical protein D7X75_02985 [Corallococcus sp. CA031C]RKI13994.1 hypothetical protein D7Y13_06630 [Corallococcus praedator]
MMKRLSMVSGLMLAITGCGGLAESEEMNPTTDAKGLARTAAHCVAQTAAQPKGQPLAQSAAPTRVDCFDTFADSIAFASKGSVQLSAQAKPADLKQEDVDQMASLATYVIGVVYEHDYYGGASFTFTSDVSCVGWNHGAPNLAAYGWDNFISSSLSYSGCNNTYFYENPNYTGAIVNCGTGCGQVGAAMNDRASSIIWTQ